MFLVRLLFLFVFWASYAFGRGWWAYSPGDGVDHSTQSKMIAGYHPKQPFPFDHSKHAGDLKMPCEHCHTSARSGPTAGVPPLNKCMGCHSTVAIEKESIQLLTKHFQEKTPIEWVKVNVLPDYVRFSHQPHVKVKSPSGEPLFSCQTCHGPVEKLQTADQWAPLQMGWCVECHSQPASLKQARPGFQPETTLGPLSCQTCHY